MTPVPAPTPDIAPVIMLMLKRPGVEVDHVPPVGVITGVKEPPTQTDDGQLIGDGRGSTVTE
jgi:hypothetical protein